MQNVEHNHVAPGVLPTPLGSLTPREAALIRRALRLLETKRLKRLSLLDNPEDLAHFLELRFAGLVVEESHVLYLDFDGKLLEAHREAIGNQKRVFGSIRNVVQRALALGADKVVFAHNHPNGYETPSDVDIKNMEICEVVLGALDITLLDSFVVVPGWVTSIKDYRFTLLENEIQLRTLKNKSKEYKREKRDAEIQDMVGGLLTSCRALFNKVTA